MRKIPNLFVRDWGGNPELVTRAIEPVSQWVADGEGIATLKRDGTACLVKDGILYKRYDAKHGKTPPPGFIPAQEPDEKTGHHPGWLQVEPSKPEDRHHAAAWKVIETPPDGTYELCGPKIGVNAEGFDALTFVRHGSEVLDDVPRDYDGMKEWFDANVLEGVVWHHPDGRMVKVKRRDFGLPWGVAKPKAVTA